jgi:CRISPR/Cas system CMR-associated protein Cmr3 (group 5 of RAMP superfamily)
MCVISDSAIFPKVHINQFVSNGVDEAVYFSIAVKLYIIRVALYMVKIKLIKKDFLSEKSACMYGTFIYKCYDINVYMFVRKKLDNITKKFDMLNKFYGKTW